MRARTIRSIYFALLGGILSVAVGCDFQSNKRYTVEMTVSGRVVKATSDKIASITFDNQHFVISLSGKKCIVERERVLYDGKEQAKIPDTATNIQIEYIDGKLSVVADGTTVREAIPPH